MTGWFPIQRTRNVESISKSWHHHNIDRLEQERRNSSALAMKLRLSCTNPSICNQNSEFIHHLQLAWTHDQKDMSNLTCNRVTWDSSCNTRKNKHFMHRANNNQNFFHYISKLSVKIRTSLINGGVFLYNRIICGLIVCGLKAAIISQQINTKDPMEVHNSHLVNQFTGPWDAEVII